MREVAVPAQPGLGGHGAVGLVRPGLIQAVQPALDLGVTGIAMPEKLLQLLAKRGRRSLGNVLSLKPFQRAFRHKTIVAKICSMSIGYLRNDFNPACPHPSQAPSPSVL